MADTSTKKPLIRHEEFCVTSEPRLERYAHLTDDPKTGRSAATHDVTRCLDCGAANYQPRS